MASDWERTHVELPLYRHRNRGNLWLVQGKPLFLPGASLADVVGLVQSIDAINNPPAVKPAKPAPPVVEKHDFPRFVTPHRSHVVGNVPNIYVDGLKFSIDRDSGAVSVMVKDAAEEARLTAPKGGRE